MPVIPRFHRRRSSTNLRHLEVKLSDDEGQSPTLSRPEPTTDGYHRLQRQNERHNRRLLRLPNALRRRTYHEGRRPNRTSRREAKV